LIVLAVAILSVFISYFVIRTNQDKTAELINKTNPTLLQINKLQLLVHNSALYTTNAVYNYDQRFYLDSLQQIKNSDFTKIKSKIETSLIRKNENACDEIDCSRNIQFFQVYHISKCGDTNLRGVLKEVFNFPKNITQRYRWSFEDNGFWKHERENAPELNYNRDPQSPLKKQVFILGLVRNPFSYYRSLYNMLISDRAYVDCKKFFKSQGTKGDFRTCTCTLKKAFNMRKSHLFWSQKLNNNATAFHEFVEFIMSDELKPCHEDMQHQHSNLMLMNDGSMAYDSVVMQENYYPMIRKALQKFDCCMPNVTNFKVLDQLERMNYQSGTRHFWSTRETLAGVPPDFCFYSPELRRLVEKNDAIMMKRYNYTWETFVGNGKKADRNDFAFD